MKPPCALGSSSVYSMYLCMVPFELPIAWVYSQRMKGLVGNSFKNSLISVTGGYIRLSISVLPS